jgi:hypothetical protein
MALKFKVFHLPDGGAESEIARFEREVDATDFAKAFVAKPGNDIRRVDVRQGPKKLASFGWAVEGDPPTGDVGEGGVSVLLVGAHNHGAESDPMHEIGDLQDVVRAAWAILTRAQRAKLLEECEEVLQWQ